MAEITLGEPLASQLRAEAEAQGMAVEDLIGAALRYYRFQAQRSKLQAEAAWWRELPEAARLRYAAEFVAVHDRQIVDHDRDEASLRRRIRLQFGKTAVLITPGSGQPEWRVVSTRLIRA
jgi:hypothetical protein